MPKARKTLKSLVVGGRKGGAHGARDPLLEISNYEAQHGYDMLTAEADAARPIPKIRSSEVMDRMSRIADNVARFIAVRTLKVAGTAISNPDQVKERVSQLQAQTLRLMKNGQEALAHNYELLLAWAHSYAMTGNGKLNHSNSKTQLKAAQVLPWYNNIESTTIRSSDIASSSTPVVNNTSRSVSDPSSGNAAGDDVSLPSEGDTLSKIRLETFNLDEGEQRGLRGLLPPQADQKPLSLKTMNGNVRYLSNQLDDWGHPIPKDTMSKLYKALRYMSFVLGWLPSSSFEKTWVRDDQNDQVLTVLWTIYPFGQRDNGMLLTPVYSLLCSHIMILVLTCSGPRAASWLDKMERKPGQVGRFLRWGMVQIRFIGYDEVTLDPDLITFGVVGASKGASLTGDRAWHAFTYGALNRAEFPLQYDISRLFGMLAVISKVMDGLDRIFKDVEYGKSLLKKSKDGYIFTCKPEYYDCPVFVVPSTGAKVLKHPTDISSFGKTDTTKAIIRPLCVASFTIKLSTLGAMTGLLNNLTTGSYRRTYAMNCRAKKSVAGWQIAQSMGHLSGNKDLHRFVYEASHSNVDQAATYFGSASTSTNIANAVKKTGSIPSRLDPTTVSEDEMAVVRELLDKVSIAKVISIDDKGNKIFDSMSDKLCKDIIDKYSALSGGVELIAEDALAALMALVDGDDDWNETLRKVHPFKDMSSVELLEWLSTNRIYACSCCGTFRHSDKKDGFSQFQEYNKCLAELKQLFACGSCNEVFPLEEAKAHVGACIDAQLKKNAAQKGSTFESLAMIQGKGRPGESAVLYVCPIKGCRDSHKAQDNNADLDDNAIDDDEDNDDGEDHRSIAWRPSKASSQALWQGGVTIFNERQSVITHIIRHLFNFNMIAKKELVIEESDEVAIIDDTGHIIKRAKQSVEIMTDTQFINTSLRLNVLVKGISYGCPFVTCIDTFSFDKLGPYEYLSHLVNRHKLPLFRYGDGSAVLELNASDFTGKKGVPSPYLINYTWTKDLPKNLKYVISSTQPRDVFVAMPSRALKSIYNKRARPPPKLQRSITPPQIQRSISEVNKEATLSDSNTIDISVSSDEEDQITTPRPLLRRNVAQSDRSFSRTPELDYDGATTPSTSYSRSPSPYSPLMTSHSNTFRQLNYDIDESSAVHDYIASSYKGVGSSHTSGKSLGEDRNRHYQNHCT